MSDAGPAHEPVLLGSVLELLAPRPGHIVLDATVGLGGHAAAILPRISPGGWYIGLDIDGEMLSRAEATLSAERSVRLDLVAANYADFEQVLARLDVKELNGVLIDLGINSAQLNDAGRGFSLDKDGPLDMRFDRNERRQAIDLVNGLGETELADLFYHNAQEGQSRRIARQICQARRNRRIATTRELAAIVESAMDRPPGRGRTHPATRVFQALRIAVNRELDNLEAFLARIVGYLSPSGRLAVISFHSLEDGLVKRFLREQKGLGELRELTKRPVGPERDEVRENPRSRSAKLRVSERTEAE